MEKLKEWRHTIELLGLAGIVAWALTHMRVETWERFERLFTRITEDPMAAAGVGVGIIGALRTIQIAWKRDPNARPTSIPATRPPPAPREGGFAHVDVLLVILAIVGFACLATVCSGCGASARASRLDTIAVAADVIATAGDLVEAAAETDARTCTGAADVAVCLAPIRARWAPVDASLGALRLALLGWLAAERIGDGEAFAATLARVSELYAGLVDIGAPLGLTLPTFGGE